MGRIHDERLRDLRGPGRLALLLASLLLAGCGGDPGDDDPEPGDNERDLLVIAFTHETDFTPPGCVPLQPRDSQPTLTFSDAIDAGTVNNQSFWFFLDGDQDFETPCNPADGDQPAKRVPGEFLIDGADVTFIPSGFFAPFSVYCLVVPALDLPSADAGAPLAAPRHVRSVSGASLAAPYVAWFHTANPLVFAPFLLSVSPGEPEPPGTLDVDPATCVTAFFPTPVDTSTVNEATFQLTDVSTGDVVAGRVRFADPTTAVLCPDVALQAATLHRVILDATITDCDGIPLGTPLVSYFTTR